MRWLILLPFAAILLTCITFAIFGVMKAVSEIVFAFISDDRPQRRRGVS